MLRASRLVPCRWPQFAVSIGVGLCCLWPSFAGASDPQSPPARPEGDEPPPTLVVLTTGQVFSGPMTQRPEGYMVDVPNGEVLVPYAMVRAAATSLAGAYGKMRDNLTSPTANDRLELARWCLTYNLVEEARQETLAALKLEPERREARLLLQQIEARRDPGPVVAAEAAPAVALGELSVEPRSIAGVSRESLATFVRQVQPLLSNRCGNARCHGTASENRLRLEPVSATRINRYENDKNLSVVLGFLDPERPDQSLLLARGFEDREPHGGLFAGPKSAEQKALLSAWVAEVAPQLPPRASLPRKPSPATDTMTVIRPQKPSVMSPQRTQPAGNQVDEAFLRRILDDERPDAFDPDEFNRLVHGVEVGTTSKTP
jgi:hypothetical protein